MFDGAHVFAEQAEHGGLVGLHHVQAGQAEPGQYSHADAAEHATDGGWACGIGIGADAGDQQPDAGSGEQQHRQQKGNAGEGGQRVFFHGKARIRPSGLRHIDIKMISINASVVRRTVGCLPDRMRQLLLRNEVIQGCRA